MTDPKPSAGAVQAAVDWLAEREGSRYETIAADHIGRLLSVIEESEHERDTLRAALEAVADAPIPLGASTRDVRVMVPADVIEKARAALAESEKG